MNSGPLLFLGLFAAMASSFAGLILAPQLQIGRQPVRVLAATGELYPAPRPGLAQQGAEVYRANGCVECHSQQVRQTGADIELWLTDPGTNWTDAAKTLSLATPFPTLPARLLQGLTPERGQALAKALTDSGAVADVRVAPVGPDIERKWGTRLSVAQDYLRDYPVLIGNQRLGPDLASVGARLPDANWHLRHLYDPRLTVPGSMMPRYHYLFEKRVLQPGEQPSPDALRLDDDTKSSLEVVPKPEAHALVSYLLSLRVETPLFEAPAPKLKPVEPATNAPVATPAP